jgi:nucleoside-diphosphate-sugar epimerase
VRLLRAHPVYCHDKAARELGFSPRALELTLADTAAFLLKQQEC